MSKPALKAAPPVDRLRPEVIFHWDGQDIRTLPRRKLLQIIGELGSEVKDLREKNTRLESQRFYRR